MISAPNPLLVHYNQPAKSWMEAIPLGNGHIGAMTFGVPGDEQILLNEGTFWSGTGENTPNPDARALLPELRQKLFAGAWGEVDALALRTQGPYTESYQPIGSLKVSFPISGEVQEYRRELDLNEAIASCGYSASGQVVRSQTFVSYPDRVLVHRLQLKTKTTVRIGFDPIGRASISTKSRNTIVDLELVNIAPTYAAPAYRNVENPIQYGEDDAGAMRCSTLVSINTDGNKSVKGDWIEVSKASEVEIRIAIRTSFSGPDKHPGKQGLPQHDLAVKDLKKCHKRSFSELFARHLADYGRIFGRVQLKLGSGGKQSQDTMARIEAFQTDNDPDLAALVFQFGRYLLISSSRQGGSPANLQGIWNLHVRAPWSSNYTININTEMNYWPSDVANIGECQIPLFQMLKELAVSGEETAREYYGCRGWTAHHNTDLWRLSNPVGAKSGWPGYSNWPMGGPWLATHIWEHYLFSEDKKFLADNYEVIKGAARFCLDWLIEDQRTGKSQLITAPSTSPELGFKSPDGKSFAVLIGCAMDLGIMLHLFDGVEKSARILGRDDELIAEIQAAKDRMWKFRVGARGQLMEWDEDFMETEVRHRHVSHLYAAYPGSEITIRETPRLAGAVRRSMDIRGDEATGWAMGWRLCLWARLKDSSRAYGMVRRLIRLVSDSGKGWKGGGIYANLFGAHPPFQIDGNFGYTAGVCEVLLQSHAGYLEVLPALPVEWSSGEVEGLRARGNLTVGIRWKEGRAERVTIASSRQRRVEMVPMSGMKPTFNGLTVREVTRNGTTFWVLPLGKGENLLELVPA